MTDLARARCFNHALREAAARCPECGHTFCRECVTEHNGRLVCVRCLERLAGDRDKAPSGPGRFRRPVQLAVGLVVVWLFFYYVGLALLSIPHDFHEGTFWEEAWTDVTEP